LSQSTHIKLPIALHARLKALALQRGMTMTELIADLIDREIEDGKLPDVASGCDLEVSRDFEATRDTIPLHAGPKTLAVMTLDQARHVPAALEEVIIGEKVIGIALQSGGLIIRRIGTGTSLEPDFHDPRKHHVVTSLIARGLARKIRIAINQIR
jgi:predicted DNA-binding ribbon-helix-helix protein